MTKMYHYVCEYCQREFDKPYKKLCKHIYCSLECFQQAKIIDLTGQKFGRLTVIKLSEKKKRKDGGHIYCWLCKCDCGNETIVKGADLKSGRTQSCGCLSREMAIKNNTVHGKCYTRIHHVYYAIKQRCYNKNNHAYKSYGGRGITICDEWKNDFMAFYNWAYKNGYDENAKKGECTIDRIDNNKGYSPENCRWITQKEQMLNTRKNHFVTYKGKTQTITEWAKEYGFKSAVTLRDRLKLGWDIEKALNTPIQQRNK